MTISKKKIFLGSILILLLVGFSVSFYAYFQLRDVERLKALVSEKLQELSGRKVSIGAAEMDFFPIIRLKLEDVALGGSGGQNPDFTARSFWVAIKLLPLLKQKIEIQKVILKDTELQLIRDEEGRFNWDDLTHKVSKESGVPGILKVSLMRQLVVKQGRINFIDYFNNPGPRPAPVFIKNINLTVKKKFLTTPLTFALSGEILNPERPTTFDVGGRLTNPSLSWDLAEMGVKGRVKIDHLHLLKLKPYLKKVLGRASADSWVSLESDFSGSLNAQFQSTGKIRYSFFTGGRRAVFRDSQNPHRGTLNYQVTYEQDTLRVLDLNIRSGNFNFRGEGAVVKIFSDDPRVSFSIQTSPFLVNRSQNYPALMVLPEEFHKLIQSCFQNGTLAIKSIHFGGTLRQLKNLSNHENQKLLSGELLLKQVDWKDPLPDFEKVSGSLKFRSSLTQLEISKAIYKGLPLSNIHGTIRDLLNNPVADLSIENTVDLAKLQKALREILSETPYKTALDGYQNLQGKGFAQVYLKGPLNNSEEFSITGDLSMRDVSLYEKGVAAQINNFQGKFHYDHLALIKKDLRKSGVPFVRFEELAGDIGKSSFSEMAGKIFFQGGAPVRETTAIYNLDKDQAGTVWSEISKDTWFSSMGKIVLTGGRVLVNIRSRGNPEVPESVKEWGQLEFKDLSFKNPGKFQPWLNLTGTIEFDGNSIRIKKIAGWYGSSPFGLEGEVKRISTTRPEFDLRGFSPEFHPSDLKDLTLIQDIDFRGLAGVNLLLKGTPQSFYFRHKAELSKTSYDVKKTFFKPENAQNTLELSGRFSDSEGLVLEKLVYDLEGNKIIGKGRMKSLSEPLFSLDLHSAKFPTLLAPSFTGIYKVRRPGMTRFKIRVRGDLRRFEEFRYQGSLGFAGLSLVPKDSSQVLTLRGDVDFNGDTYKIKTIELTSDQTKVRFSGVYQSGRKPKLDLKLNGGVLVLEEILPGKGDSGTRFWDLFEGSGLLAQGTSRFQVGLKQFNFKFLRLNEFSGDFTLKNKKLRITKLVVGKDRRIQGRVVIELADSRQIMVRNLIQAKNVDAGQVLGLFGDVFQEGLKGKVQLLDVRLQCRGNDWEEIKKSLTGKIFLDIKSGMVHETRLKEGMYRLVGAPKSRANGKGSSDEKKDEPTSFKRVAGSFTLMRGVAESENFIYETQNRRVSLVGKFDLTRNRMDTVIGVAPFEGLNKFLMHIPFVGKIITGGDEKSLVKTYYKVVGPFEDPKITPIPITSLGKRLIGIFQGILQAPGQIFVPPEPSSEDFANTN